MTVCVAIKVHDCIVFAADSASSLMLPPSGGTSLVSNVYKHGLKVFNLHRDLPIVAMTSGLGNFGSKSISNLAKDLRMKLMDYLCVNNYTIGDVARYTYVYLETEYKKSYAIPFPQDHLFEFWIGGYGHDDEHGEIWKIMLFGGKWQGMIKFDVTARPPPL